LDEKKNYSDTMAYKETEFFTQDNIKSKNIKKDS
jgi:hypothetical protein